MANLAPIGSVVVLSGRRFVVVGHRMTADGDVMAAGYLVVPYPLGFVGEQSLFVVPAHAAKSIVHQGFLNNDGAAYLREYEELVAAGEGVPTLEYEASVRLISDFMREEGRNGR